MYEWILARSIIAIGPVFETVKSNLVQSIVGRLEDEVVKELVNALYHFAMTRLNPDDVTVSYEFLTNKLFYDYLN